jgi:hydroxypyruvate isomerase
MNGNGKVDMALKQSFCLPCFHKSEGDLADLLREAKKIGFAACEIWFRDDSLERIAALARENNLVLASMCGHKDWRNGLNRRENHDRIEAELRASVDVAAKLNIPGLICFSGERDPDVSCEESLATCALGLKRVMPYAEKNGVTINVELLNSKVDHVGYECDRTSWAVELCKRVKSTRFRVLYDIYHAQIMEGDIIRTLRDNIQWIGHIHTAGNPGRHDLDDDQEVNYAAIARALAQLSYDGYIAHEFFAKGDPVEALRRAFEICNSASLSTDPLREPNVL